MLMQNSNHRNNFIVYQKIDLIRESLKQLILSRRDALSPCRHFAW
jgi:hypothetical protein